MISPKAARDRIVQVANVVVSKVVGYQLKTPALFDYYEGEAPLDWPAIKAINPIRVVFQATVGEHGRHSDNKPDRQVANFIQQAKDNNIKYGLYHLLLPNNITEQAKFYINTVESLGGLGNMMPIMDVEVDWMRGTVWAGQVKAWVDIVQTHFNKIVLAYTSKYYWSYLNDRNGYPPLWSKDLYYWGAGYPFIPYLDSNVIMPHTYLANGFTDWSVWQYYDRGRPKYPANDLNLVSPAFADLLNAM